MNIEQILEILKKEKISHYLNEISEIHMYTKHYLLLAEELSEEGVAFLQPLKEHRDAYDHMSRIYALALRENINFDIEDYILDNIKKAFGHEYRAFFDMADWLTYICRKYVREQLQNKLIRNKYQELYNYNDTKEFINQLPFYIAKYRENKDVSKDKSILSEVLEYKATMDKLIEIYQQIQKITI